ncbi:MAG: hypothetical protein SGJ21_04010 [Alphaproteobacteria bacterium]|nr:hypothetical protein [Alphaproteobacteria bacterium]
MNRRELLAAGGLAGGGLLSGCATGPAQADPLRGEALLRDVETYVGFGVHRSGGPGDVATSNWLASRWRSLGYQVEQESYDIPNSDASVAALAAGAENFPGFAQPPIVTTGAGGLKAALALWDRVSPGGVAGRIAIVHVPRPPGAASPGAAYRAAFAEAQAAGAVAIVAAISGPSGDIVAINTPVDLKPGLPILALGERELPRLQSAMAAGGEAVLRIEGPGGMRRASNTIARHGETGPWLIVSTPQSGWFTCGGERGPGVAISLALSEWALRQKFPCRLLFVGTSGHEWTDFGAHQFHKTSAPEPDDTALWFHLGASFAARGYEETAQGPRPLEVANPVRSLMVSNGLLEATRTAFAGQAGIEAPMAADGRTALGETRLVIEEGYPVLAGFWGAHALFHTPQDDARATTPQILETVARAVAKVIERGVKT